MEYILNIDNFIFRFSDLINIVWRTIAQLQFLSYNYNMNIYIYIYIYIYFLKFCGVKNDFGHLLKHEIQEKLKEDYVVNASGSVERAPQTLPPTSGKVSNPGRGLSLPLLFTSTGYLRRCPCNGLKSSAVNLFQFSSAILFTHFTQFKLSGWLKQSSMIPMCSAHSDVLYP